MDDRTAKLAENFINAIPHCQALDMRVTNVGEGKAEMELPYSERIIGDPETGVVHGGAVFALMDTCCGAAAMCHPTAPLSTATIDLRIDYMRAATPGQTIRTEAECYRMTKSVAFVRAVAMDDFDSQPVATATGAFTVERK